MIDKQNLTAHFSSAGINKTLRKLGHKANLNKYIDQ